MRDTSVFTTENKTSGLGAPTDTLTKIANRFGVTQAALMAANKITNANSIQVGQKLVIP